MDRTQNKLEQDYLNSTYSSNDGPIKIGRHLVQGYKSIFFKIVISLL